MKHETVLVLDFGGQYNELIARRVRDLGVYCEVHPYKKALEKIKELSPIGIIFTGGPNSVYEEGAPKVDPAVFQQGLPILGLCYGLQMMSQVLGGEVQSAGDHRLGFSRCVSGADQCLSYARLRRGADPAALAGGCSESAAFFRPAAFFRAPAFP